MATQIEKDILTKNIDKNSCLLNNQINFSKLIKSMKNYPIKKQKLSDTMKNNFDKLGIKYAK